ncbi:S-adenosyl-L-methionine-dependent methyltransferase [Sordaria sp. MPI-SDFR-AT-0083]|nr:S-adenosyl-L-methionine-dependent methyltransferase [Sordaria sp. MPI-SDFR-AT-0083]
MPKTKTPTPDPASPAQSSSTPGSPTAAAELSEPIGIFGGEYWLQQEVRDSDLDSTLGGDAESSTASIASSILHYRTINGRTYHSDSHLEALEVFTHALDLMLGGKLTFAPIGEDAKHAVDIGTASGFWAIDFADDHPDCEVIGTDISPVQPTWCPPNFRFEIDDANKEWTFKTDHFDYIHVRFLNGATSDWDHLYEQAYRVCKPGGWFEHIDATCILGCDDGTIAKGSALDQYSKLFKEAGRRLGLWLPISHLRQEIKDKNIHAYWRWKLVYAQKPLE